jgi:hypothetical protein
MGWTFASRVPCRRLRRKTHRGAAAEARATPAQIALAWLLAQGDDIAPIPGTKRVARVEENTAADRIELSAEQIARLNNLMPAAGERHDEGNMAVIDRWPRRGRRLRSRRYGEAWPSPAGHQRLLSGGPVTEPVKKPTRLMAPSALDVSVT